MSVAEGDIMEEIRDVVQLGEAKSAAAIEKGTVEGWVVLACSNGGSAHEGVRDMVVQFLHMGLHMGFLGFWASFRLLFLYFLITQGLHTINNKTLVIVQNYRNKYENVIVNVVINMHFLLPIIFP